MNQKRKNLIKTVPRRWIEDIRLFLLFDNIVRVESGMNLTSGELGNEKNTARLKWAGTDMFLETH